MATLVDDGIRIIDADTHFTEPYDMWTSRAPAKYKDRVPHVEEIDGQLRVLNDQTAMATITLNVAEAAAGSTSTATFASAWRWALRALHASITGVVVAVGFVLPFALIALLCAMAWVGVRRVRARPTPTR